MNFQYKICKLCSSAVEKNDEQIINDTVKEILQTLIIKVDLIVGEQSVICSSCHKRAEENYRFKNKCVFTEKSIKPFLTENVRVNLNEIRNEIIKSENIENDKIVCRLCLEFVDSEMTLSEAEKEQFKKFFPEINLNLTNYVMLCSTCYDTLQKYFLFVTSCSDLDDQLSRSYSMDYTEQKSKLENSLMNIEEDEKKVYLLQDELNIKCKEDADEEKYPYTYSHKLEPDENFDSKEQLAETQTEKSDSLLKNCKNVSSRSKAFECNQCSYECKWKSRLSRHILAKHTDPATIAMHKCDKCDFQTKFVRSLKDHIYRRHTDRSKVKIHKCQYCTYESGVKQNLNIHIVSKHTDASKISVSKCELCEYKSRDHITLNRHILTKHADPSKIPWYQCKLCDYKTKWSTCLKKHIITNHTDPSKIPTYNCEKCDYKSKFKGGLKRHVLIQHADKHKGYKCEKCAYESKNQRWFTMHVMLRHANVKIYKCESCDYVSINPGTLKSHNCFKLPAKILYKCEKCNCQYKCPKRLKSHITKIHA